MLLVNSEQDARLTFGVKKGAAKKFIVKPSDEESGAAERGDPKGAKAWARQAFEARILPKADASEPVTPRRVAPKMIAARRGSLDSTPPPRAQPSNRTGIIFRLCVELPSPRGLAAVGWRKQPFAEMADAASSMGHWRGRGGTC
jgi:hypothetical protein